MAEEEKNLKQTLKRLKQIIADLEGGEAVDVEAGLEKVKEGAGLVKQARKRFDDLENEFADVKEDLEEDAS